MRFYLRLLLVGMVALAAGRASASDQSHFFDDTTKPAISFDKVTMTWTVRNRAIERVIHFDTQTGALSTVALHEPHGSLALTPPAGSEGTITFADPVMEVPKPLMDGWQSTDTAPPSEWTQPFFPASGWKDYSKDALESSDKPRWFRCKIPADRMKAGNAYTLIVADARPDEEVYVDGMLATKVGPNDPSYLQLDLVPKNRVVAIKIPAHALALRVLTAEVGTSPPPLDLTSNWQYALYAVNAGDNGSLVLTISLSGVKKYEGFDINVNYQIFPGDEPFLAKWFEFNSHRSNRFLMEQVTYDRLPLPATTHDTLQQRGQVLVASDAKTHEGLMATVLSPMGRVFTQTQDNTVVLASRPYFRLKPNAFQMTPKALIGVYHGLPETGLFLHQLFVAQYVARGSASGIPPVFNTDLGYGNKISATTCAKIIPIAATLGIKIFTLGDGWQTNVSPNSGSYGDWVVDRSPDKFPDGLLPLSTLLRERNMGLGLWMNATAADPHSQIGTARQEWLTRPLGSLYSETTPEGEMCFTSGWAETFTQSTIELCRELAVSYLHIDGSIAEVDCYASLHDHPIGHRKAEEVGYWTDFCDAIHKLDPACVLNAELPALLSVGQQETNTTWPDAKPLLSAGKDWYQSADARRALCAALTETVPSFLLTGTAPCHLDKPDINALEYNLTTGAAYVGNMEVRGKLEDMTPEEQAVVQKWVKWNDANRPWLAYALPLHPLGTSPINGVLHLRPAMDGRYGYLCLWNPSDKPEQTTISFHSSDYFVRIHERVDVFRIKDGSLPKYTDHEGAITVRDIIMPPRSWEIYEIRQHVPRPNPKTPQDKKTRSK